MISNLEKICNTERFNSEIQISITTPENNSVFLSEVLPLTLTCSLLNKEKIEISERILTRTSKSPLTEVIKRTLPS